MAKAPPKPNDIKDPINRARKILGPFEFRSLNKRIQFDETAWNNDFNIKKISVLYRKAGMNLMDKGPKVGENRVWNERWRYGGCLLSQLRTSFY